MIIGSVITVAYNVGTNVFSDQLGRFYVRCDGRDLSQTLYPDLFRYLGTRYNNGAQPAGFFRIPDLRGAFLRGAGGGVDTDAPARTIDGPGNPSSDAGTRQNRAVVTHSHNVYEASGVVGTGRLIAMQSESSPSGAVIFNNVHINPTNPGGSNIASNSGIVSAPFSSATEPTATASPNHIVCDYIIRIL